MGANEPDAGRPGLRRRLGNAVESSALAVAIDVARQSTTVSWLRSAAALLAETTRRSATYRWLTATPEPTRVVVDLRESATLGWVVAAAGRFTRRVRPYWTASGLRRALALARRGCDRVAASRVGAALLRVLEPPPNDDDET